MGRANLINGRTSLFLPIFCLLLLLLSSCGGRKKNIVFYENSKPEETDTAEVVPEADTVYAVPWQSSGQPPVQEASDNEVSVPFVEQGGEKYIDVTVNGQMTVKMIVDSGCSTTLISIAEARYLYEKGCISEDDFLGMAQTQVADGSIDENMVINLREIVIADRIVCYNVAATVAKEATAPLLLGNGVLDRASSYSVDNDNKLIRFTIR